jgi:hypothetical protein
VSKEPKKKIPKFERTMRMIDGVHSHTTSLGPAVALRLVLVVSAAGLEERLVGSSTTCDDANGSSGIAVNRLLGAYRRA